MKIILPWLVTGLLLMTAAVVSLQPGESGALSCTGDELTVQRASLTEILYECLSFTPTPGAGETATPTATSTTVPPTATSTIVPPTATAVVPTATPTHDMADMAWHAPGAHGDRPYHEHGDAPPQWVLDAGYTPTFDHVAGTPNENHAYYKHTGFKGWAGKLKGVEFYGIFHLDVNPSGHPSRFHSYQLWLRDATGAVSHMSGWMDFGVGNNTGPNLVATCGTGTGVRPLILVNKPGCPLLFEAWYMRGNAEWQPGFGFSINPNYYTGGDPADPTTWLPTGRVRNTERRVELTWIRRANTPSGDFWTTQFSNIVSGPNDPMCGTTVSAGERSYTVVCLKQTIQPSLPAIEFPGNSVQQTFAQGQPIQLPN